MTFAISRRLARPWWMTNFGREPLGDVFFDRLWPEWSKDSGDSISPDIDFSEKDGKYFLTAELPGLKKEDISITIEDGYVTVSGKKESNKEEDGTDYYVRETRSGSFSRSFRLPGRVNEKKVDASFKDGILTVVLPHDKTSDTKKIEIH